MDGGAAWAKILKEGVCRRCGSADRVRPVHTVSPEKQDRPWHENSAGLWTHPDSVVPLCGNCEWAYKNNKVGILLKLTQEEQVDAVQSAGGILPAVAAIEVTTNGPRRR